MCEQLVVIGRQVLTIAREQLPDSLAEAVLTHDEACASKLTNSFRARFLQATDSLVMLEDASSMMTYKQDVWKTVEAIFEEEANQEVGGNTAIVMPHRVTKERESPALIMACVQGMRVLMMVWAQYWVIIDDIEPVLPDEYACAMEMPDIAAMEELPPVKRKAGLPPLVQTVPELYGLAQVDAAVLAAHQYSQANMFRQVDLAVLPTDEDEQVQETQGNKNPKSRKADVDQERVAKLARQSRLKGLRRIYINLLRSFWVRVAHIRFVSAVCGSMAICMLKIAALLCCNAECLCWQKRLQPPPLL